MRIHRICSRTRAEGPGKRFCIWVQGCSIRCEGCFNQHMWDPSLGYSQSVEAVLKLVASTADIEGVTVLGGEPFDQADELVQLLGGIKKLQLSTMVFTGYTYEELISKKTESIIQCLNHIDLLVDGPYQKELASRIRPWVGSDNQKYYFLTSRYSMNDIYAATDRIEVYFKTDGIVEINGIADHQSIRSIQQALSSPDVFE